MMLTIIPTTAWATGSQTISLVVGGSPRTVTDYTGNYENETLEHDTTYANVTVTGTAAVTMTAVTSSGTYVISDGNGNYLKLDSANGTLSNTTDPAEATEWTFNCTNTASQFYQILSGGYYLNHDNDSTLTASTATIWFCKDGTIYTQAGNDRWTVSFGNGAWSAQKTTTSVFPDTDTYQLAQATTRASTTITFTPVAAGNTSVTIGGTTYDITVTAASTGPLEANLSVTARYTSNRLAWEAEDDTAYKVEYSTDNVTFTTLSENVTAGSYIHDTLQTGTQYWYRVSANGQTSDAVQAEYATGLEALKQTAAASWGFAGTETKVFDGSTTVELASSGSDTANKLSAMTEGTIVFRANSKVASGYTAAVGSDGLFWAGSEKTGFRLQMTNSMKATLKDGTTIVPIQDGYFHTSAFAFDAGTPHWVLSANGKSGGGNNVASGFLSSSNSTTYYVGSAPGVTGVNGFNGTISFVLITGEVLSDAELNKLTGDNLALEDEEVVLGSAFSQVFYTNNTAGSNDCSNTWMFDGGNTTAGHFSDIGGARSYVYQFEEYIRWHQASGSGNWSGRQRYVFSVGKTGQTLAASLAAFDSRVSELNPRAVAYLVGPEDYNAGESGLETFKDNLKSYIEKGLALRNNTGFVLIQTPVPVSGADNANVELYANAVKAVLEELTDTQKPRVQIVDHVAATWSTNCFNEDGTLNAKGHLEMGRQICEALFGSATGYPDTNTSSSFPNDMTVEPAPAVHLSDAATVTAGSDSLTVTVPNTAADVTSWTCTVETPSFTLTTETSGSSFTITGLPEGESYVLTMTAADWSVQLPVMAGTISDDSAGSVRTESLTGAKQTIADLVKGTEPLTWLFMGDSITHGALWLGGYDSITQTFEKYVKDDLGRQDDTVINTAVSSAAVADTMTYINERLKNYSPDVVAIMLGTNNRNANTNYKDGLKQVIDAALNKDGVQAVVLRIPIPDRNMNSNLATIRQMALDVAEEYAGNSKVIVIDQYEAYANLMENTSYMNAVLFPKDTSSGLHPSAVGQLLMAKLFIEGIGLSLNNTYIGSLAYDIGTTKEASSTAMSVTRETGSISLDVDALSKLSGQSFFTVTLKAEDKDGNVYSVTGNGSTGALTLSNLPEASYTVTAEALLSTENKLVTYAAAPEGTVTLSESARTLVKGRTFTLTAAVEGDSSAVVTWESSDPSVATVENGKITAVSAGTAIITASYNGSEATCTITVLDKLLKAGSDQGPTGTTQEQPLDFNTGGSYYFRIPALITLSDGTLVAAADARYTTTGDGGGLDTIVSISTDHGATWKYSYPLYFPDSNGYAGTNATTIIDPILIMDDEDTIYLMADVNPTGVTTMSSYIYPGQGTGYIEVDGKDRLALTDTYANVSKRPTDSDSATYQYYVGDFENGYAPVVDRETDEDTKYVVDEWYNLYEVVDGEYIELLQKQVNSDTDIQQNVFYKGSVLHVYNTGYLWLATSTDKGETWSHTILNTQIKRDPETALLVSPGRGLLLKNGDRAGTVIIPLYDTLGSEQASFIWSSDNGETWTRTANITNTNSGQASENEMVELADGTLRMFFRNSTSTICYVDAVWDAGENNYVWQTPVSTGVACRSGCNISAIMYSKEIDGKDAILVACPSKTSAREDGRIFVFLVDETNSMTLEYTFHVNEGTYCYSCLTELNDGRVGLLWEYQGAAIRFDAYDITEIADGAEIDGEVVITVPLYGTRTETVTTVPSNEELAELDSSIAGVKVNTTTTTTAKLGTDANYSGKSIPLSEALYTFKANSDGTYVIESCKTDGVYLNHLAGAAGCPGSATSGNVHVQWSEGNVYFYMTQSGDRPYSYLYFHSDASKLRFDRSGYGSTTVSEANCKFLLYRPAGENDTSSTEIPGYVQVSSSDGITSGNQYLIIAERGDSCFVLYPSTDTSYYTHVAKVGGVETYTEITYTGLKEGDTSYTDKDGIKHTINVVAENLVEVPLKTGETYETTVETDQITMNPESSIAAAEIETEDKSFSVTGAQGNLGTSSAYNGGLVPMSNALYLFTANDDGSYVLSAKTSEGITVYLCPRTGSAGYPSHTVSDNITFTANTDNTFYIKAQNYGGYLFFWRDGKNRFDQQSGTADATKFLIFRPATESDDTTSSAIPGYVQITDARDIEDGGYYLIVAEVSGSYYALYPSTSTGSDESTKCAHVVKVNSTAQSVTETIKDITYTLNITGTAAGTTDVMVDGVIYRVTVTEDSIPVTGVTLDKTTLTLTSGNTAQLTATVVPSNAVNQKVSWSSSNTSAATVDENGNVTAVGAGTATITVTTVDGSKTATCTVTVKAATNPNPPVIVTGNPVMTIPADNGAVSTSVTYASYGASVIITTAPSNSYQLSGLTATDAYGNQLPLTDLGNGRYAFTMPASAVTVRAAFAPTIWTNPYVDVSAGDWFYDEVRYVTVNGLMKGVAATAFDPYSATTRGMIVTILHRLEGCPAAGTSSFADVAAGQYYTEAVAWAAANGIVVGYDSATFAPNKPISREELAAILYRYAAYKGYDVSARANLSGYTDAARISGYAVDAMAWANAKKLINGVTATTLVPQGSAVRSQVAAILARFCENVVK